MQQVAMENWEAKFVKFQMLHSVLNLRWGHILVSLCLYMSFSLKYSNKYCTVDLLLRYCRHGGFDVVTSLIMLLSPLEKGHSQILDVCGSSEGFSWDGLDEVLTQISGKTKK